MLYEGNLYENQNKMNVGIGICPGLFRRTTNGYNEMFKFEDVIRKLS